MCEVETRLAEIRERIHDALAVNDRPGEPCNRWLDADVVLDQLARVRTDTIEECAKAVEAVDGLSIYARKVLVAAVRGVSHGH